MAQRDYGNPSYESTSAVATNPTTATLVAELDSTLLGSTQWGAQKHFQVSIILGATTNATWQVDQALSTGLGSTGIREVTYLHTPSNQSGQYVLPMTLEPGDRIRVRPQAAITGNASAKIVAEQLT